MTKLERSFSYRWRSWNYQLFRDSIDV